MQLSTRVTLNPEQMQAVSHIEGPMLVLAGAGSGKTRVIIERILHLLEIGVPASEILAVTFTNKAAEEMKHRILRAANVHVLTSTFHSLSAQILRESISLLGYERNFVIADEDDSEKILKNCFVSLGISLEAKEEKNLIRSTKKHISQAKNNLLDPDQLSDEQKNIYPLYVRYQEELKRSNTLDFDDLLFLTVKLLQQFPDTLLHYQKKWNFILIDEYQDTNHAQYLLIKLLSRAHNNVFAVGDPDQSIYSWRGANLSNILHFEKEYEGTQVVRLEQNYRSYDNILQAANALISHNESRYEKKLWSSRGDGEKIGLYIADNERQEAEFVTNQIRHLTAKNLSYNDCAILYRTNFQSRTFEDALLKEKIPYTIIGGLSFYQRKEIKDILSFLRMTLSDFDTLAFTRTINLPKRGLGPSTLEKIETAAKLNNINIFPFCQKLIRKELDLKLSSKQLQGLTDYVFLIENLRSLKDKQMPVNSLLQEIISQSSYLSVLQADKETAEEKLENLHELVAKAFEWEQEASNPTLSSFLEEITLKPVSEEEKKDSVRLMTLHSSKGLEFPLVFLVGLEKDLFPHKGGQDSPTLLEEERRLCYVGMTRAKDHLFLTAAKYRFLWGSQKDMQPSLFLKEIPETFFKTLSNYKTPSEEGSFAIGDTVLHKDFGIGTVERAYQTSYGQAYDVTFAEGDTRSLIAKYAKLVPY